MNLVDQRAVAAALGLGAGVGVIAGLIAPGIIVGAPPSLDPNLAGICERDAQLGSTELLDLKERVQATRVAWNRLEIELGPIGGAPAWWGSAASLDAGRAAAEARAASLGVEPSVVDCAEDPCLLVLPAASAPAQAGPSEVLTRAGDRAVLALPPQSRPTEDRIRRTLSRSDRILDAGERR